MIEFGILVREAREQKGIRAYDLAYTLGMAPSSLSDLESGVVKKVPSPELLAALTKELGLSTTKMLSTLGYEVGPRTKPTGIAEEAPAYDDTAASIARTTATWTPRQKELLLQYIESVSAALDERDRRAESEHGRETTG